MASRFVIVKGEVVRRRSGFRVRPLRQEKLAAQESLKTAPDRTHAVVRDLGHWKDLVDIFMTLPHRSARRPNTKFGHR